MPALLTELLSDQPAVEFLDGTPYRKVSPKATHAVVQAAFARILYAAAAKRGRVGTEWDFYPGAREGKDDKLVPDVAFVSRERLQALKPEEREQPPFSPDVAVEVWSPSNDRPFLNRKIATYLATGATIVLDVDPKARVIVAHSGDGIRSFACGQTFEHPALAWLRFDVVLAFADLDDF